MAVTKQCVLRKPTAIKTGSHKTSMRRVYGVLSKHNLQYQTLGTTRVEVPPVTSTICDQVCDRTVARVLLDAPLLRAWPMMWEL